MVYPGVLKMSCPFMDMPTCRRIYDKSGTSIMIPRVYWLLTSLFTGHGLTSTTHNASSARTFQLLFTAATAHSSGIPKKPQLFTAVVSSGPPVVYPYRHSRWLHTARRPSNDGRETREALDLMKTMGINGNKTLGYIRNRECETSVPGNHCPSLVCPQA